MLEAVSTLLAASPSATANQISAKANRNRIPIAASQCSGPSLEWNPRPNADADQNPDCQDRLDQAADYVAVEDCAASDGHGAESVDDAGGHVLAIMIAVPCTAEPTVISSTPGST